MSMWHGILIQRASFQFDRLIIYFLRPTILDVQAFKRSIKIDDVLACFLHQCMRNSLACQAQQPLAHVLGTRSLSICSAPSLYMSIHCYSQQPFDRGSRGNQVIICWLPR